MTPQDLRSTIPTGLLSFPVTHFRDDLELNLESYQRHVAWLSGFGAAALFAAGGTGEIFSLTPEEVGLVTRAAKEAAGSVPIIAGCAHGTALARQTARAVEAAGADGLLLLPHYLIAASQEGIFAHIKAVCDSTSLGVIVYNRDNSVVTADTLARLADACPNLAGFKDGTGQVATVREIVSRLGDRHCYVGGMPTHEIYAEGFAGVGVSTYSSAVFNFVPELSLRFYRAMRAGDRATMSGLLDSFFYPFARIRDRRPGYAVSIIKAGAALVGQTPGPVRPPLTDLTEEERAMLHHLIQRAG
jgi:5-dehydro-4-deoxyglucarate dehydratase